MKIIQRNKKHLGIECDHCKSILKLSPKDIEEHISESYDYYDYVVRDGEVYAFKEVTIYQTAVCPVCKKDILVNFKNKKSYECY